MNTEKLFKVEIENSVLSAILYDNTSIFDCELEQCFFTQLRVHVYHSIEKIVKGGGEANIITVSDDLKGVVPASVISAISDTALPGNLKYYVDELSEANRLRVLFKTLSGAANLCLDGGRSTDIISKTKDIFWKSERSDSSTLAEILPGVLDDIEDLANGIKTPGLKTGISAIDRATGGLSTGFIVIAGRPGTGKTSLAMNIVRHFAMFGSPGLVFSLEMSKKDLLTRMLCDVGSLDGDLFFRGGIKYKSKQEKQKLFEIITSVSDKIADLPINIDETSNITVDQIYTRSKKAKVVNGIEWVVVDYLGLINGWNQKGQEPKAEITRLLKVMSGELNIPVIVLSQMNRSIDQRGEKTPLLSDLRDAGSIEQDADIVLFPVPETNAYSVSEDIQDVGANLYIAKNRKGPTGMASDLRWTGKYFRYSNSH